MSVVTISRSYTGYYPVPLTYKVVTRGLLPDTAWVACANGHGVMLDYWNTIDDNGEVSPSVMCREGLEVGCRWKEHIILEDWENR